MLLGVMRALFHMCANRGRCGVKHADFVALDDLPPAIPAWRVRRSFIDHTGGTVRERSVNDVRVPGDPTDVGGCPVDILILGVKDPAVCRGNAEQVTRGGVEDALRFRGRAGGVEQIEHIFALHPFRFAGSRLSIDDVTPPVVSACLHLGRLAGSLRDENMLDSRRCFQCLIDVTLQSGERSTAITAVGGDHEFGFAVVDSV